MADPTDSLNRIVQTKGDISITPIVINLKSDDTKETSPTPRPRVQFSDKVERFPESVPTSPNPSSPKQNEPKKFTHEVSQNGTPKIENVLSIKHNAPYSAGPHHDLVIEYEQLPKQENDNKIEANPTNNPEQSEPILTNVILNIEMVRTAKEHPPEDEDDETMARIAFSLPASNLQENPIQNNKTNQEQQLFKSANNEKDKTDQKENKSKQNLSGLEKVAKEIIESVVNELKEEKLQQIDLSPLLNKQLDNPDIAIINAEANRKSPTIAEPETNKNDETANKNVEKTNEKIVEIPIFILEKTEPFEHEAEIKRIHLGLPEFEDILGDYILTDKFIDIAIIFDDQNPSTSSEQNVGETKQAITKDQAASYVPTSKSTESASNKSQKEVDIVVHIDSENELNEEQLIKSIHKGFKVIEDLADEYISNDKFMDVFIVFENEEGSSRDLNNQSVQSPKTESDNIPTKSTGTSAAEKRPENQSALKEKLIEIAVFVEPETSSFDDEAVIKSIHKGFADAKELLEEFISLEKFVDIAIVSEDDSQSKKVGSLEKSVDISVITEPEIVPFNDETVIKKIHQGLAEVQELAGEFLSKDKFIEIPIIYADSDLSKDSINDKIVNTPPHVEDQSVLSHNQEIIKKVCQGEPPVEEIPGKYKPKERLSEIEIICAKNESTDELPEVLTPIPIIFEKDWTLPETEKSKESLKFQPDVSQSFGPAEANQKEPQNQYYDIQTIMEEEVSEYIDIPVGYIEEPMPYIDIPVGYIEEPIYFEVPVGYIEEPLYFEIPVTYDGKLLVDDEDAVKSIHKGVPLAKPLSDNAPSGPVEKFINIPIYFFSEEENKEEELKQENKIGEVHVPSETEKQKEADGVSYQSTFKKPLFEDNKPKNVAEKVEVKPEEVVFQSSFARPMSQEPSPIKKEAPTSLETQQQLSSPFQKPLPQDQKEKSKSDEHSKPSKVSEPTTPEWQKPPQNSWLDSYDDGETIWDKPTSAEVHNIPIVLPTGKVQQGNEQANISQPSKTFVSPKDNILYYEVPAEGAKQQQISQPTSIHGASKADEVELNISEYEEQLKKNTKEALQLVDKLVESSQKIQQLEREKQKEHEKQRSRSRSSSQTRNVQFNENDLMEAHSYRVNPDLLKDANSIAMIPEFKIAIADFEQGLTLFNLYTKEIKRVDGGSKWRRPQSLIYNPRAKEFFVLVEYSENDDGKYVYYILRFSKDLEYINRVEAPVFIRDKDVSVFRLCYCHRTGSLYLGASTYANGYLYELSAEEKWIEIYNCRNKIFADVSVLAVVGPVTELIVLESTRSYANILSVYGTEATHVRSLAVCEKPGTLCIDETGHIIIHDKATSKICLHSRVSFLKTMEIALVDHSNVRLSAWDGLLAVLCPNKKDLRIYKY